MYAHVTTYRLSTEAEVAHEMRMPGPISDQSARTLASWYHSPSPADRNTTALSHGLPFDTEGLREEVLRDFDPTDAHHLLDWLDNLEEILS